MSSYQESSTSIEEDPTFSDIRDDSFAPSLTRDTRDSVITYTTDLEDSSVLSSTTDLDRDIVEATIKRKSIPVQHVGPPFYRRRRFWAICTACSIVSSAIFIPLLFLVIIPNIAQSSVNKSEMNFDAINITNPTNDSFVVSMSGTASGTGPFGAKITFNGPVNILYNGGILGSVELDPIEVSNGKGSLVGGKKLFTIREKNVFNDFTSKVLTASDFEWTLQGTANVKTLGMNINNLKLNKAIRIPGSNSFQTTLLDLKITENPDKSLSMEAVANIYNPSPIGIEVGDMTAQLSYNQTIIATTSAKDVFLGAKGNNITMTGITNRPASEPDRLNLITVVNGFLTNTPVTTTAKILSLLPPGGPVDWLNSAVKDFSLPAVVGNSSIPQKLIKNLDLGEEKLVFTADDPYSPTISSTNAVADYELPFNINFTILEVGQKITISHDNKDVVSVESPEVPVISTNNQITLNISETKLQVLDNDGFSNFLVDLTTKKESEVVVYGKTNITVNTDILGQTTVQGVPFNLTTTLQGFDQFNSDGSPPTVGDLTILHGDPDKLYLGILVTLTNPSKYSTSIGRVTFDMFYNDKHIGTTIIPDLTVVHGANPVQVAAILDSPGNNPNTKELFTKFLSGQPATINIKGNDQSTNIKSLIPAFKAINIPSTIPPFTKQLLQSAKIVLDNQTATTNISTSAVEISNPFLAPISIYSINSTFNFNGIVLGTLVKDFQDPIFIPGNTVLPLQLPVTMAIDPVSSFTILRTLALQNNLDVTVLDSLIALTNVTVPGADPNAKPTPDAIKAFDLGKFVTTALANIPITISMDSQVAIGECFLSMSYKQNIIATTDQTILNMIPALAAPLVNRMIDQTEMIFDSIFIQDIDVASFNTLASGRITNSGVLPATISFPTGADVYSDNVYLGKASVPPISTDGSGAATFNNISRFDIGDIPTFASFSAYSYTAASVTLEFISDNVMITSFGLPIGPISIKKTFQMDGFNGLKQFTLGGITFPFAVTINVDNPSKVGADIGKVVYDLSVNSEHISTITSDSVIIHPNSVSTVSFHGDLNLTNISSFFSSSTPPLITAQGISVSPPKATGEVVWLSETLKSFTLTAPFSLSSLLNGNGPGGALPALPAAPAAPPAAPPAAI